MDRRLQPPPLQWRDDTQSAARQRLRLLYHLTWRLSHFATTCTNGAGRYARGQLRAQSREAPLLRTVALEPMTLLIITTRAAPPD